MARTTKDKEKKKKESAIDIVGDFIANTLFGSSKRRELFGTKDGALSAAELRKRFGANDMRKGGMVINTTDKRKPK